MIDQLTLLQLVLDHLKVGNNISTIDDRIAIQKAVCLTQEAGLQLGYGFSWYVRGPYSTSLTNDYYQISSSRSTIEKEAEKFVLTDSALAALNKVQSVIQPSQDVTLPNVRWLELLASIAFLMKRYKLDIDTAKNKIETSKPQLFPFFDQAYNKLKGSGLLE
jgi:hypothetical protein